MINVYHRPQSSWFANCWKCLQIINVQDFDISSAKLHKYNNQQQQATHSIIHRLQWGHFAMSCKKFKPECAPARTYRILCTFVSCSLDFRPPSVQPLGAHQAVWVASVSCCFGYNLESPKGVVDRGARGGSLCWSRPSPFASGGKDEMTVVYILRHKGLCMFVPNRQTCQIVKALNCHWPTHLCFCQFVKVWVDCNFVVFVVVNVSQGGGRWDGGGAKE